MKPTRSERVWTALGFLVTLAVAGVSAWSSWGHIDEVSREAGEKAHAWIAVSVDGMMLTGAIMSFVDKLRGYRPRGWALVALWLGSMMTVAFNIMSALDRGPIAVGVAVVPAIGLIVSVEVMFKPSRRLLETVAQAIAAVQATAPEMPVAASVAAVEPVAPEPAPVTPPSVAKLSGAALDGLAATAARPPRKRATRKPITVDTDAPVEMPAPSAPAVVAVT